MFREGEPPEPVSGSLKPWLAKQLDLVCLKSPPMQRFSPMEKSHRAPYRARISGHESLVPLYVSSIPLRFPSATAKIQKNPRAHKNKIGTPPPPNTPPKKGEFYGHGFPAERTHFFQVSIKLAHPFPAPELRTRILRTRGFSWKISVKCVMSLLNLILGDVIFTIACTSLSRLCYTETSPR